MAQSYLKPWWLYIVAGSRDRFSCTVSRKSIYISGNLPFMCVSYQQKRAIRFSTFDIETSHISQRRSPHVTKKLAI
eukprot:scaffold17009_cov107-Skeletonema_marinoi.AAC.3